jgi:phosphoribosylaminoimidazole carboxylase/phosphoribosylaminoimidazole-succinocarboxamide synthase
VARSLKIVVSNHVEQKQEQPVEVQTAKRLAPKPALGALVAEGKTKKIHRVAGSSDLVALVSKDDITAGDGAKHDVIPEKGRLANQTTCNVFRLLKACGLPVAFEEQDSATSFVAPECSMLPYEVVVRREAHGSYLKRNPHFPKGQLFPRLIVELFLKTKDKNWKGKPLVCDDPLLLYAKDTSQVRLFNPAKPMHAQEPFLILSAAEVFAHEEEWKIFPAMERIASGAFLALEKAWQIEAATLVDLKVEFGFDSKGRLLLADVIDNDSWRVIENGSYIDKQVYRDGGALDDVAAKYRLVAEATSRFRLPRQRIILWRGSETDKTDAFSQALGPAGLSSEGLGSEGLGSEGLGSEGLGSEGPGLEGFGDLKDMMTVVTCSVHKDPTSAASILHRMVQEIPDSVVIAYIGRSNGAGPTLSAMSTIPVITVPASVREFPDDIWSSLRAPSKVPVMTVLEPANAVLAALQILSARNPRLYARVRQEIETRTVNTMAI